MGVGRSAHRLHPERRRAVHVRRSSARFSPFGQQIWTFDAFREDVAGAGGAVYAVYSAGELYIYIYV